jgi:hypothetical protein
MIQWKTFKWMNNQCKKLEINKCKCEMSNKRAKNWNKFEGQNEMTRKAKIVDITFEQRK